MIFFRIDPAKNIRRFWLATVQPTLLGGWSLIREWGRVGQPGTVKARTFESEADAQKAEQRGRRRRERNGYQPTLDVAAGWSELMAEAQSICAPKRAVKTKSKAGGDLAKDKQGDFDF